MIVVGQTSGCHFQTIQSAIDYLEKELAETTLYILAGVYEETVTIYRSDLRLIGLGQVEIRMSHFAEEWLNGQKRGTFWTATCYLGGRNVWLENLTIVNEAGPGEVVGQAIALYADCHEAVFKNCRFKAHQDTLCTGPLPDWQKNGRPFEGPSIGKSFENYDQYYLNCYIEGTVDVIFGGATAYFEACEIKSLTRIKPTASYLTAASTPKETAFGLIFDTCFFTAQTGVAEVYLGRPWRPYAKTMLTNCQLGDHIAEKGWDDWGETSNQQSVQYTEYGTIQKGYLATNRVPWSGQVKKRVNFKKEQIFRNKLFWKRWQAREEG
ncbi:pectin esterase [Vagococcus sp. BWB3-3]|uniref:Pectin esterase n=1 Tax=Vagococcus allomyrinae TaxID=2794353 RepID=A0A940PFJ2_9ENTE|nr:pectinesterase family protein [Vagococcus allomyrinae]MBP1043944.1 pectin esterase [Vagococcus allomyrinae]